MQYNGFHWRCVELSNCRMASRVLVMDTECMPCRYGLGGTSLSGGSGSVARAMIGCAVIAVINNGMNLLHINSYWQKTVIGAIILLAVILDMAQKKKKV